MKAKSQVNFILIILIALFAQIKGIYANDAEEAQMQGLTVQEYKALKGKKWNSSISTGYLRGVDEFAEGFIYSGLNSSYELQGSWLVGLSASYLVPSDLEAEQTSEYGILDTDLYISKPNFGKTRGGNRVGLSNSVTLPTSVRSRRNSFIVSNSTTFSVTKQPLALPRLTLTGSATLVLSHYDYEESISGTEVFSPFGLAVSGRASFRVMSKLFWSNGLSVYNRINYEGRSEIVQTLTSSLSFAVTNDLSASASFRWQDKYITNDPFLDDNKSRTTIGLSYLF